MSHRSETIDSLRLEESELPWLPQGWFWSWLKASRSWRALSRDGLSHVGVNTENYMNIAFHSAKDIPDGRCSRVIRRTRIPAGVILAVLHANGVTGLGKAYDATDTALKQHDAERKGDV